MHRCWTELTREIKGIPSEFAPAVSSGRPKLARLIQRPLTLEETQAVADALIVLLETTQSLQKHSSDLAVRVKQLLDNANGLHTSLSRLQDFAEFRNSEEDESGN